jgi:nucleoside-diphosphate-sugar epimerase
MANQARSGKSEFLTNRLVIGCGYLGHRVAQAWRAQGYTTLATTRGRFQELRELGLIPIFADVTCRDLVPGLPAASTTLIAVGIDRTTQTSPRDVYLRGLENILSRLPAVGRVIYISSTGVYGPSTSDIDEATPVAPEDETGQAIVEAEQLLLATRPEAIILRFAGIYGPGRLPREKAVLTGQPLPTDPNGWLNLIHVADGVAAVLAAEQKGCGGAIYNISDGQPVRRGDFYRSLAELLHAPPPTFVTPAAGERGSRRVSNRKMREELQIELSYPSYQQGLAACLY